MLAYLYSRYPVVSQTFCDSEMMALEELGVPVIVGSLNPPPDSFRHERLDHLKADVLYPPPKAVLDALPRLEREGWEAMAPLVAAHDARYGAAFKASTRARNALYFARRFKERGVRHVHVHFANRATHTALFMARLGLTFSFTAHAKDFMVDLGSDDLLREMADAATLVVAVSDFSRTLLEQRCPEARNKIFRVYNGIDPAAFPAAQAQGPGDDGAFRIASVGRMVGFKGFETLVQACALLRAQDVPAVLTIVGEGPRRKGLEKLVENLGLGASVDLLGHRSQDEVRALLARSHAFALACTEDEDGGTDILPTVIMEAMAARLPVVSTRFVGVPEMVDHGTTGTLVPRDDPAALAAALATLYQQPDHARLMGEAGRRRATDRFAINKTARELHARLTAAGALDDARDRMTTPTHARPAGAFLVGSLPHDPDPDREAEVAAAAAGADFEVWVLAMGGDRAPETLGGVGGLDFLPDGVVLEAAWRRAAGRWPAIDRLRADLGGAIDGELFYREARRAVYLGGVFRKRGVLTVHASRSDTVLLAWLLARMDGFRVTMAVERKPSCPRSLLARMADAFADGSVADARLEEMLGGKFADVRATMGEPHGARRFPFRRARGPAQASPDAYASWLRRLAHAHPEPEASLT